MSGRLKIFLGYASRVGKSERMFDEGRRRRARGQDVVVGAAQDEAGDFESIPLRAGEVDVEAILRRRPQVCLIDALGTGARWKQVRRLLEGGINVVTAVNLQFISPACVPEGFIHSADELVIVDAPSGQHTARREEALLLAAQVVEEQLNRHMEANCILHNWGAQERVLVCITARSNSEAMLRTGEGVARAFHGHLLALHVGNGEEPLVSRNLELARQLGAEVHVIEAVDPVTTILRFAQEQRVTQIFIGHTQQPRWKLWKRTPVSRLIREAEGMDVRLFPAA